MLSPAQKDLVNIPAVEGGGKVFIVSNLNDKGPGSFREAAEAKEKRMIVFAVSGTIHLETRLSIKADVTIAGQTAPVMEFVWRINLFRLVEII